MEIIKTPSVEKTEFSMIIGVLGTSPHDKENLNGFFTLQDLIDELKKYEIDLLKDYGKDIDTFMREE